MKCTIGEKDFLTLDETIAYLGVCKSTVYEYRKQGLRVIAKGGKTYYDKDEIKRFMRKDLKTN